MAAFSLRFLGAAAELMPLHVVVACGRILAARATVHSGARSVAIDSYGDVLTH